LASLLFAGTGCIWLSFSVAAEVANDAVSLRSSDGQVTLEANGAARREVFERFFAERDIRIDWLDAVFASEGIEGTFAGTTGQVVRKLLADANFVIVFNTDARPDREPHILRVVVIGRAAATQMPSGIPITPNGRTRQPATQVQASATLPGEKDFRYEPRPPHIKRRK